MLSRQPNPLATRGRREPYPANQVGVCHCHAYPQPDTPQATQTPRPAPRTSALTAPRAPHLALSHRPAIAKSA
jgi:hypothetical protein